MEGRDVVSAGAEASLLLGLAGVYSFAVIGADQLGFGNMLGVFVKTKWGPDFAFLARGGAKYDTRFDSVSNLRNGSDGMSGITGYVGLGLQFLQ